MNEYLVNQNVVKRLKMGDFSFGCGGKHRGNGTEGCPHYLHHHHDEFCNQPTVAELWAAGIDPTTFKSRRR